MNVLPKKYDGDLTNSVTLAELGGYGDGPYCAKHGKGAGLVMMGTYIVDEGESVPYPSQFVFKAGKKHYEEYLARHVRLAGESGARVGVSVVSVRIEDTAEFLDCAQKAGAHYISLCAHSTMEMFVSRGVSSSLCLKENRHVLEHWAKALIGIAEVPLIFKVGLHDTDDTLDAVDTIFDIGVPIVHINIGRCDQGSENLELLREMKEKGGHLIVGGGIKNVDDAGRVIEAGADSVAIGTAAMKDPDLCGRIQSMIRK